MKMRKLTLAISLVLVGTASALAADIAPSYTKAPVVAPIYNWTGVYIGLNGGGASSHNCWDVTGFRGFPITPSASEGCHNATGGLAGGQIGYRWQASSWVFGLEAQGNWANLKASNLSLPAAFGNMVRNTSKIDAIGLFTGQVGYAWNNVLWYVKGGAAATHDKYDGFTRFNSTTFDQASETRWGGAVGTGVEFGFAPGWSVAVEYDHLFMGRRDVTLTSTLAPVGAVSRNESIKQDVDMGTVRVNYTFGGPVVAKY
ncbi:outer membrane protein [Bradyrhizobium sp. CCGUVB1N3]|uniref:outer membrane protein n=1 Tax=Bradyrhizobium sp. CCGUVB1N3 TaxID=2949629 RepID=UPI0035327890